MILKCTNRIQHMILLALFSAISLTIFILELHIPVPVPIPGAKLGLSNVITLILIDRFGKRDALVVLLIRVILGSLLSGQVVSFLYSLVGGVLAFGAMCIINSLLRHKNHWFTSAVGAVFHNTGQIIVAVILLKNENIIYYFFALMFIGIITGCATGLLAGQVCKRIRVQF